MRKWFFIDEPTPEPSYAYGGNNPFKRRKKRRDDDMDFLEKFIMFQAWLKSQNEGKKDEKKDDKKPEPRKIDTTGLAMFLMVFTFFCGQASMLYLYNWFLTLPK